MRYAMKINRSENKRQKRKREKVYKNDAKLMERNRRNNRKQDIGERKKEKEKIY